MLKLAPVPLAGLPPVAVQLNVYGEVPPEADAEQLTAVPTVPVAGHVIDTASGVPALMLMVADFVAVAPLLSVTVRVTV